MSGPRRRRGNWGVQELERLRVLLPRRGVEVTATLLRRSPDSIYRKAMEIMGRPVRRGAWTAEDDALVRDAWGVLDLRLLGTLVGRSPGDVAARGRTLRQELRSGPWSGAERLRLRRLYGTRSDADLVVAMQRPAAEIAEMARELCLAKDKRFVAAARRRAGAGGRRKVMPRWTVEQVELLRALYPDLENLEVARRLGRSVASVANKANQLGLRKNHGLLVRIGRAGVRRRHGRCAETGGLSADSSPR